MKRWIAGLAALLAVSAAPGDAACEPDAETLCLHEGRYELRADWRTGDGSHGAAKVVPEATRDSGLFRFFDADNWEVLIKVVDGCAINGHHWVFGASTTDLGYEIRVRDTATGAIRSYRNAPGRQAPAITDAKAFPDGCEVRPRPELVSPGSIAVEWNVWEADVPHDDVVFLRFAADFDGDGDDDVLLGPSDNILDPAEGVILLNNGDFTFEVAGGDRPRGVVQREVLMADFNGDGGNDFFIADHGYDVAPFPGWHNQLLLWTPTGYQDGTGRLPDDPDGFTHNAAVGDIDGDGDVDILVANALYKSRFPPPYFLMNDGDANFVLDQSRLPGTWSDSESPPHWALWPWAVELADLDADGHLDLLAGARGEDGADQSYVYWGSATGRYRDDAVTVLPTPGFFLAYGGGQVVSVSAHDIDGDGRLDILLGGYDDGWFLEERGPWRGVQLLVNRGGRVFVDETSRRLGPSAWSAGEGWHWQHLFFDFNGDGTVDIVPQDFDVDHGTNVLAWLNDGTGHYAALSTTAFDDLEALGRFSRGVVVRAGGGFKYLDLQTDGARLTAHAGVVVQDAMIRRQTDRSTTQ